VPIPAAIKLMDQEPRSSRADFKPVPLGRNGLEDALSWRQFRGAICSAFGQDQESNIVDALRANGAALLSLVATVNDRVAGHIMYSPLSIGGNVTGAALARWE
jgi:hypothetical protein